MPKLMIWETRCPQSTPKVRAISWIGPCASACANNTRAFIIGISQTRAQGWLNPAPRGVLLADKEQSVEHDGFGEGNGQDRLYQDLGCRARIASDRFRSFHANETHTQGRAQRGQPYVQVSVQFRQQRH